MKNIFPAPHDEAILIGRTETLSRTREFWVHAFNPSIKEVYVFVVDCDTEGSFATVTLPYAVGRDKPERHYSAHTAYWERTDNEQNTLSMFVPTSSHYGGMEAVVFDWVWEQLYGPRGGSSVGVRLHPESYEVKQLKHMGLREAEQLQLRKEGKRPPTRGRVYKDPDGFLDFRYTPVGWEAITEYVTNIRIGILDFRKETGHVPG